jgi:hypothetical protein
LRRTIETIHLRPPHAAAIHSAAARLAPPPARVATIARRLGRHRRRRAARVRKRAFVSGEIPRGAPQVGAQVDSRHAAPRRSQSSPAAIVQARESKAKRGARQLAGGARLSGRVHHHHYRPRSVGRGAADVSSGPPLESRPWRRQADWLNERDLIVPTGTAYKSGDRAAGHTGHGTSRWRAGRQIERGNLV